MSLEKCNTKMQRYEDSKSEDEISHQIIGVAIREPLFIDIVVDDKVLIEVKATEKKIPDL